MREHKNPIKVFKELVKKTQNACDALGIKVKVNIDRCDDEGRFYLAGDYLLPIVFNGEVRRRSGVVMEEIYRGDEKMAFDLFMGHFSKNRVAYLKATDDEILEYNDHPDLFQPS